jgi:tetratricopeptide (TPR) repeat protein
MRKQNAIFFVSGLVFGLLVGYFLFQSVSQSPPSSPAAVSVDTGGQAEPSLPILDREEVSALERLAEENPDDPEVRDRLGTLYMESGHYEEAVRWFRECIERNGDDLHVRNHLALSLTGLGRIDEAITEYEAVLAVDPSHPQSLLGLGRVLLYGKSDIQGGIEVWNRLVETAPESREAQSVRDELEALRSAHSGN